MHTNHNQMLRRSVAAMAAAVFSLSALASGITVKISRQPLNRALEEIEKVRSEEHTSELQSQR